MADHVVLFLTHYLAIQTFEYLAVVWEVSVSVGAYGWQSWALRSNACTPPTSVPLVGCPDRGVSLLLRTAEHVSVPYFVWDYGSGRHQLCSPGGTVLYGSFLSFKDGIPRGSCPW
jgi:hypothetical protein